MVLYIKCYGHLFIIIHLWIYLFIALVLIWEIYHSLASLHGVTTCFSNLISEHLLRPEGGCLPHGGSTLLQAQSLGPLRSQVHRDGTDTSQNIFQRPEEGEFPVTNGTPASPLASWRLSTQHVASTQTLGPLQSQVHQDGTHTSQDIKPWARYSPRYSTGTAKDTSQDIKPWASVTAPGTQPGRQRTPPKISNPGPPLQPQVPSQDGKGRLPRTEDSIRLPLRPQLPRISTDSDRPSIAQRTVFSSNKLSSRPGGRQPWMATWGLSRTEWPAAKRSSSKLPETLNL